MENDIIYRRDAINAMIKDKILKGVPLITNTAERDFEVFNSACDRHAKIIEGLPSAQPNLDEWCRDCKEYDKEKHCCPRWNRVIRQTVEDLKAEAQPERKEGAWVLREDLYGSTEAKCSECGFEMLVNEEGNGLHEVSDLHYCPNCGADMRGDDHAD